MLASDWFAQAGKARVLKACTSMGRPVSEAMGRSSAEPAKRVGERRERHWVALCVPLCLCGESADRLCGQLTSRAELFGSGYAGLGKTGARRPPFGQVN